MHLSIRRTLEQKLPVPNAARHTFVKNSVSLEPPLGAPPPGGVRHILLQTKRVGIFLDVLDRLLPERPEEMQADPWPSATLPLWKGFVEETPEGSRPGRAGHWLRRAAGQAYRLRLHTRPCPDCAGYDDALGNPCPFCLGTGAVPVRAVALIVARLPNPTTSK